MCLSPRRVSILPRSARPLRILSRSLVRINFPLTVQYLQLIGCSRDCAWR